MKNLITLSSALLLSLTSLAHAGNGKEIIESSVVQTTLALMQAKNDNTCVAPTEDSIHWMCTGAIPPVRKLEIMATGCGFAVEIQCGKESASIFGQTALVYAIDGTGVRRDVEKLDLGFAFQSIRINPNR
jgi:hypothetical protein